MESDNRTGLSQLTGEYDVLIRGGCIRLGPPGPYLYVESNHGSIGIVSVGINAVGDLVVSSDFGPNEVLVSAVVAADFTLAAKRIFGGVSGGGVTSTIRFTDSAGVRVRADSDRFDPAVDNIWFQTVSILPI